MARQYPGERQLLKLGEFTINHICKNQIGKNEIHHQASRPAGPVAMPFQQIGNRDYVFGGFQSIEVIRIFAEPNPAGTKLLVTLAVPDAHAAPVITLDENKWPRKRQTTHRRMLISNSLP